MKDYTCNGKCSNCGNCCIPWLPITKHEYKTIKEYIKRHKIKPQVLQEGNDYYMDCCFHDRKNKKCTIYEVRPEVCKNFMCSSSCEKIDKDRKHYDDRAHFNGKNLNRFYPFDLLFYDDPRTLLQLIVSDYKPQSEEELKTYLVALGHKDLAECIQVKEEL